MTDITISLEKLDNIKLHHIIAQARTGSTLLATMLNQHSKILCVLEYPFGFLMHSKYHRIKNWTPALIDKYCHDFFEFAYPTLPLQFSSKEELKATLMNYCKDLNYDRLIRLTYLCFFPEKDKSNITTIVNKHLTAHFYLNQLARYFPESKFILLRRLPIDTIARQINMRQVKNRGYSIQNIALNWQIQYKKRLKSTQRLVSHRKMIVPYEQLITQQLEIAQTICKFFELNFENKMLTYPKERNMMEQIKDHESTINELGDLIGPFSLHEGASSPPDTSKIGAWVNQLSNEEGSMIWKICEPVALKMGMEKHPEVTDYRLPPFFFIKRLKKNSLFHYTQLWYALPLSYKIFFRKARAKLKRQ